MLGLVVLLLEVTELGAVLAFVLVAFLLLDPLLGLGDLPLQDLRHNGLSVNGRRCPRAW